MSEHPDGFVRSNVELAMCAQMNFENAVKMMPALALNPIFKIAKTQLDALVARLNEDDAT